jgi:hypothetical protein
MKIKGYWEEQKLLHCGLFELSLKVSIRASEIANWYHNKRFQHPAPDFSKRKGRAGV